MRNYLAADDILNDGMWVGLSVGERNLEAQFITLKGVKFRLKIDNVLAITCFGFGLRNTVEGIYTQHITPESVLGVVEEIRKASCGRSLLGDDAKLCEAILKEGMALLVIEPSEGGGLLAICDPGSIELIQIADDIN